MRDDRQAVVCGHWPVAVALSISGGLPRIKAVAQSSNAAIITPCTAVRACAVYVEQSRAEQSRQGRVTGFNAETSLDQNIELGLWGSSMYIRYSVQYVFA